MSNHLLLKDADIDPITYGRQLVLNSLKAFRDTLSRLHSACDIKVGTSLEMDLDTYIACMCTSFHLQPSPPWLTDKYSHTERAAQVYKETAGRSATDIVSKWKLEEIASFLILLSSQFDTDISNEVIFWSLKVLGYHKIHKVIFAADPYAALQTLTKNYDQTIIAQNVAAVGALRNEHVERCRKKAFSTLNDIHNYIARVGIRDHLSLEFALAGAILVTSCIYLSPKTDGCHAYISMLLLYFNHNVFVSPKKADSPFEEPSHKLLRDLSLLNHYRYRVIDVQHAIKCCRGVYFKEKTAWPCRLLVVDDSQEIR